MYMHIYLLVYIHPSVGVINVFHKLLQDEIHEQNQQAGRIANALPMLCQQFDILIGERVSQVRSCRSVTSQTSESSHLRVLENPALGCAIDSSCVLSADR